MACRGMITRPDGCEELKTAHSLLSLCSHLLDNENVPILNRFQKRKQSVHAQQRHPVIQVVKKVVGGGDKKRETGESGKRKVFSPFFWDPYLFSNTDYQNEDHKGRLYTVIHTSARQRRGNNFDRVIRTINPSHLVFVLLRLLHSRTALIQRW